MEFPTLLEFDYTNWKGEPHHYKVRPTEVVFQAYGFAPKAWVLRANVIERSGQPRRGVVRSFKITGMTNIKEIADETR